MICLMVAATHVHMHTQAKLLTSTRDASQAGSPTCGVNMNQLGQAVPQPRLPGCSRAEQPSRGNGFSSGPACEELSELGTL